MRLQLNARLERDLARSPGVQRVLDQKAREVANDAERMGRQVARSYETTVEDEGDGKRVISTTDGINPTGWIEWGTGPPTPTPPYAPMRRATEAAGLKIRSRRN